MGELAFEGLDQVRVSGRVRPAPVEGGEALEKAMGDVDFQLEFAKGDLRCGGHEGLEGVGLRVGVLGLSE